VVADLEQAVVVQEVSCLAMFHLILVLYILWPLVQEEAQDLYLEPYKPLGGQPVAIVILQIIVPVLMWP
jgi:hypothetical protein